LGGQLLCTPGWLGVRYRPPGKKEDWRVFVPEADVEPEPPKEQVAVIFKDGGSELDAQSKQRLAERAQAYPRGDVRVRISARYASAASHGAKAARINGLMRLSAIDSIVRRSMAPENDTVWELTRKYELIAAPPNTPPPDAIVEFYAR
jgi:hypothetical protein